VLAIVGPTGTGKTELASEVARRTGAEVISVDSMQVYRGMDIGTAKASRELRAEIPHHGIDLVNPDEPMSAGRFATYARQVANEILARGRRVILCGGTGLYARAFAGGLVDGIDARPEIRAELRQRGLDELYAELRACDPVSAQRIHPRDRVRIERALEVHQLVQRPLSAELAEHGFRDRPFDVYWLGLSLERDPLWRRLRERVDRMFASGLVEEVRALYAAGYGPTLRPLQAIGYREVGSLLAGRMTESEARDAIWVATRRYAKRQRTWFRAEPGLVWLDAERPESLVEATLRRLGEPGAATR
jgi:tRNA dimethylallyltransferase